MNDIFVFISGLLNISAATAFLGAFLWGVMSIVLSPCHLSSIPLVVGYIESGSGKKNPLFVSAVLASGVLVSILVTGVLTGLAGRLLGDLGIFGKIFMPLFLLFTGLLLLDVVSIPGLFGHGDLKNKKGLAGAFFIGVLFGLALGPCTFAFMAPVLVYVFSGFRSAPARSLLVLLLFAIGHGGVIVVAGAFTGFVNRYLGWDKKTKTISTVRKACGALLIIAALYAGYHNFI